MLTTRQYNEARAQWARLDTERKRLEAAESFEHDARLVEIQDEQHRIMLGLREYRAARSAGSAR